MQPVVLLRYGRAYKFSVSTVFPVVVKAAVYLYIYINIYTHKALALETPSKKKKIIKS